jgi:hypothetical protein
LLLFHIMLLLAPSSYLLALLPFFVRQDQIESVL